VPCARHLAAAARRRQRSRGPRVLSGGVRYRGVSSSRYALKLPGELRGAQRQLAGQVIQPRGAAMTSKMRPTKSSACRTTARMAAHAPLPSRASRTVALARLTAVAVVAAVCAAGFGAETQAATPIYIQDITSVPKIKPSRIVLTNHAAVSRLRWSSYGGTRATATGKLNLVQCEPTCAEGTSLKYRARITVSAPRTCEEKRYYTKIRVRYRSSGVWKTGVFHRLNAPC
jgi:hypothetical protein